MPILKDLDVVVCVNNIPLKEYVDNDEEQSPNTASRYIEAVSGSEFGVRVGFSLGSSISIHEGIRVIISLDGEDMAYRICKPEENSLGYQHCFDGSSKYEKGKRMKQKFKFSEISITEEASHLPQKELKRLLENLGIIKVTAVRIKDIRYLNHVRSSDYSWNPNLSSNAISEKALKGRALSHRASLGEPQPTKPGWAIDYKSVDSENAPFAVYRFKYCSKNALRTLCVIPRSPTPIPLEQRPVEELSREELLELMRRRPVDVKSETKPATTADIRIKRERDPEYGDILSSAQAQKVAKIDKPVEVIDLLD